MVWFYAKTTSFYEIQIYLDYKTDYLRNKIKAKEQNEANFE